MTYKRLGEPSRTSFVMTARVFGTHTAGHKAGKINPNAYCNIQTVGRSISECSKRIHSMADGAPYKITSKGAA